MGRLGGDNEVGDGLLAGNTQNLNVETGDFVRLAVGDNLDSTFIVGEGFNKLGTVKKERQGRRGGKTGKGVSEELADIAKAKDMYSGRSGGRRARVCGIFESWRRHRVARDYRVGKILNLRFMTNEDLLGKYRLEF